MSVHIYVAYIYLQTYIRSIQIYSYIYSWHTYIHSVSTYTCISQNLAIDHILVEIFISINYFFDVANISNGIYSTGHAMSDR